MCMKQKLKILLFGETAKPAVNYYQVMPSLPSVEETKNFNEVFSSLKSKRDEIYDILHS
jgi:hypothetical protein